MVASLDGNKKDVSKAINLNFSQALDYLNAGYKLTRFEWVGDNNNHNCDIWISKSGTGYGTSVPAKQFWSAHNQDYAESHGGQAIVTPSITMRTKHGRIMMGWTPNQIDIFGLDWAVVQD